MDGSSGGSWPRWTTPHPPHRSTSIASRAHARKMATQPASSTVLTRLAAIGGLYEFAVRMGVVAQDPASAVRRPSVRTARPRGLTAAEIGRLLAVIPETPTGLLDRALIVTAILTGLRRSELVDLRLVGAPGGASVYYEVRTKGGVVRRRELPSPAVAAIADAAAASGRDDPRPRWAGLPDVGLHLRRAPQAPCRGGGPRGRLVSCPAPHGGEAPAGGWGEHRGRLRPARTPLHRHDRHLPSAAGGRTGSRLGGGGGHAGPRGSVRGLSAGGDKNGGRVAAATSAGPGSTRERLVEQPLSLMERSAS